MEEETLTPEAIQQNCKDIGRKDCGELMKPGDTGYIKKDSRFPTPHPFDW